MAAAVNNQCGVCLNDITQDDIRNKNTFAHPGHSFHRTPCLQTWARKSNECPFKCGADISRVLPLSARIIRKIKEHPIAAAVAAIAVVKGWEYFLGVPPLVSELNRIIESSEYLPAIVISTLSQIFIGALANAGVLVAQHREITIKEFALAGFALATSAAAISLATGSEEAAAYKWSFSSLVGTAITAALFLRD